MEKIIKLNGYRVPYRIIRRRIKYPRMEFKTGNLRLILPVNAKNADDILKSHKNWISRKYASVRSASRSSRRLKLNLKGTELMLKKLVTRAAKRHCGGLEQKLNGILTKKMKTKWASMSSRGNLTINTFLKYLPRDVIDYVIFHELAHLIERRHNTRFWDIIETKHKNHQEMEKKLFEYWFTLQNALERLT